MIDSNLTALIENIEDKLQKYILDVIHNVSVKRGKITKLIFTSTEKSYPRDTTSEQILNDPDNIVIDVVPKHGVDLPGEVCILPQEAKERVINSMVAAYQTIQHIKNNIISLNYTNEAQGRKIVNERLIDKVPVLTDLEKALGQSIIFNRDIKNNGNELLDMTRKLIREISNDTQPIEDYTLIKRIKSNTLIDYWANGKAGRFEDIDGYYQYRFCEVQKNENGYNDLYSEQEKRNQPILACGFVAWLIKHWGEGSENIYSGYLQVKLTQYKNEHKNDPDAFKRDLEREFYDLHPTQEEKWVKHSEAIFEFISASEVSKIKEFIEKYFEFVDTQSNIGMEAEDNNSQPSLQNIIAGDNKDAIIRYIIDQYKYAKGKDVAILMLALKSLEAITLNNRTDFYKAFLQDTNRGDQLQSFRKGVDKYLSEQGKDTGWLTNLIQEKDVTPLINKLSSLK